MERDLPSFIGIMESSRISHTLTSLQNLISRRIVKVSAHGYDELAEADLYFEELLEGFNDAILIEDYPLFPKGPCVLVLQKDGQGHPVHVVWGTPKGFSEPAVLITAYRPDDTRWDVGFTRRKR